MSKTYRYDPEADSGFKAKNQSDFWKVDARSSKRPDRKSQTASTVKHGEYDFKLVEIPRVMTVEWALMKMQPRVNWIAERLVGSKIIPSHDKEDIISLLNMAVVEAFPSYTPLKKSRTGRRASVVTYLRKVIDNAISDEIRARCRHKRIGADAQGMTNVRDGVERLDAVELDEGNPFCYWLKARSRIELKMDIETMRELLESHELRRCFDLKIEGRCNNEIAEILSQELGWEINPERVRKTLLKRIREVLVENGYGPMVFAQKK